MLSDEELKIWLHRNFERLDKLLLVLAVFDDPCQVKDIKAQAANAGFRIPAKWNVSAILGNSHGLAIRTPMGWELTDSGKQHLSSLGVSSISPAAVQIATDLRALLPGIADDDTRAFAEEAVKCYELELYRSAIVMSWLAAIDVLHKHVHANALSTFNNEARRVDSRWRNARTPDDLGRMKEADFLDRLVSISVLGRNAKKELKDCLDRRNGCGHPNSLRVGPNTVAHHLEVLLLNVFQRF